MINYKDKKFIAWCEDFLSDVDVTQWREEWRKVFHQIDQSDDVDTAIEKMVDLSNYEMFGIFGVHAAKNGLGINVAASYLMISMADAVPGKVVMFIVALRYAQIKNKIDVIKLKDLVSIFKNGIPNSKKLERLWNDQKVNIPGELIDNMVDLIDWSDNEAI